MLTTGQQTSIQGVRGMQSSQNPKDKGLYRTFRLSAGGAALLEAAFAPDASFDSGLLSPGVVILGRNPASSLQCSSFRVSGAHISSCSRSGLGDHCCRLRRNTKHRNDGRLSISLRDTVANVGYQGWLPRTLPVVSS